MIRSLESQENFYIIRFSDSECVVLSNSYEEAACIGLKKIIQSFGNRTNLSFWLSVDNIDSRNIETNLFYAPKVLHDIGYFNLAKNLANLSDFFLDKGKNPH
jgi:hypothetical protein